MSNKPTAAPAESKPEEKLVPEASLIGAMRDLEASRAAFVESEAQRAKLVDENLELVRRETAAKAELERTRDELKRVTAQRDEAQDELETLDENARTVSDNSRAHLDPSAATAVTSSPEPHELPADHPYYKPLAD